VLINYKYVFKDITRKMTNLLYPSIKWPAFRSEFNLKTLYKQHKAQRTVCILHYDYCTVLIYILHVEILTLTDPNLFCILHLMGIVCTCHFIQ
jgi:hypothetical protein